jgi:hypothetical protein
VHFPVLFQHGELGWHSTVRHQGDAANRNGNRVACREYTADIKVKGYSMLRRAARLFLRKVSTLPKYVCLACPHKNFQHVNTESRIKLFQMITWGNLRTCTHSPHMPLFSYSFSIPPSACPLVPF